jgi:hypothetical protein
MHHLKSGDQIVFPDGSKITYQVKDKFQEEDDSDDLVPTGHILVQNQQKVDNQFKIRTDFHYFLPASRLDTRIYVQNMSMLCLLLEKELEIVRAKHESLSLIFVYYNSKKMRKISPKSYQKVLRLYQLVVNKKITNLRKLRTLPITKININIPSYIIPDDITPDFQWFILKGNNGGIELWHL